MKFRDPKSIIIILVYLSVNIFIVMASFRQEDEVSNAGNANKSMAPEYTIIENLDYFHLKGGVPQLSLAADKMVSLGEEQAEFDFPKGVYNYQAKNKTLKYIADFGIYKKDKEVLTLEGKVGVTSDEAQYFANKIKYYLKKDLILGSGDVKFMGDDLKTRDHLVITSSNMRANPEAQFSKFTGNVKGTLQRKKKYEGQLNFASQEMQLEGDKSLAHLEGDVMMKREGYLITAGKADMYLENFNKSLKYFVLNDDVKVTETVNSPQGVTQRKAFSERLEGFGREEKMILSGAPRVEMGKDVIKGYRITIRQDIDLVEVDDAMSDVQMKKQEKKLKE